MNLVFLILGLLSVLVTTPATPAKEEAAPEEVTVQEKPDTVRDANVAEGWYRHEGSGWMLWPKEDYDMNHPPYAAYAEFLSREETQNVIGAVSLSFPFALIWFLRRRHRKRTATNRDGMDPVQFQAVLRKLNQFTDAVDALTGETNEKAIRKKAHTITGRHIR